MSQIKYYQNNHDVKVLRRGATPFRTPVESNGDLINKRKSILTQAKTETQILN